LFDPAPLVPSRSGEIVGIGCAALTSLRRFSGTQFEVAALLRVEGWPHPRIVLAILQQMPDDHSELAGDCNRADVVAATPGKALVKCPKRIWATYSSCRLTVICERFHKTLLDEFYRVAFRRKLYDHAGCTAGRPR
jgi:hypothetical protein